MQIEPKLVPNDGDPQAAGSQSALRESLPPVIVSEPSAGRRLVAALLSICLGLFLADAFVSLADDSLIVLFDFHLLSLIRGVVFFFTILATIVIYGLMALTPMVPKRWFLPITLFNPVVTLALIPLTIYSSGRIPQFVWGASICQVIVGLVVLHKARGRLKFRWPLIPERQLDGRSFTWGNLGAFIGLNIFVLAPVGLAYLAVCASFAVSHFSDGFMSLRPGGLTVQVRKYTRTDGKTIELFPMSHIADSAFYQKVQESFPANSTILMEGVTDNENLLTNKISYKRMAKTLGLAEQHEGFVPSQGELVRADVDIDQFATSTISLLNVAMLFHNKGVNAETVLAMLEFPQPPGFQEQLIEDLLTKRNHHLLEVIRARLPQSQDIVVPWGALHMPEIAREIQKDGFHLSESQDYTVIRFGPATHRKPL